MATAWRRMPYQAFATAAAVAAVLAVALAIPHIRGGSAAPAASLPAPHASLPPGDATVAQLARYHWDALPDAPISARSDGVVGVWTGNCMIVWGGSSSSGLSADGASYDPITRRWQRLPTSPLGPRTFPAYAWAGDRLFIWGGLVRDDKAAPPDGATYEPATRSWHRLPAVPVSGYLRADAVWTGSRVVLFTAAGGLNVTSVQVHAYDPARDSWTTLPSIHIPQTTLLGVSALVAGDQLYVWLPVQTVDSVGLRTDNDAFVYRPGSNSWAPTALLPAQSEYSVGAANWTGDHILFAPNGVDCSCTGLASVSTGSWADPHTGAVKALPKFLSQHLDAPMVAWTGAAVLGLAGPRAGGWDPATGRWTDLTGPPYQDGIVQVWTGSRLLMWGNLFALPSPDPNAGSPPSVDEPTGLEFRS